jgi:hypothetical protein
MFFFVLVVNTINDVGTPACPAFCAGSRFLQKNIINNAGSL